MRRLVRLLSWTIHPAQPTNLRIVEFYAEPQNPWNFHNRSRQWGCDKVRFCEKVLLLIKTDINFNQFINTANPNQQTDCWLIENKQSVKINSIHTATHTTKSTKPNNNQTSQISDLSVYRMLQKQTRSYNNPNLAMQQRKTDYWAVRKHDCMIFIKQINIHRAQEWHVSLYLIHNPWCQLL